MRLRALVVIELLVDDAHAVSVDEQRAVTGNDGDSIGNTAELEDLLEKPSVDEAPSRLAVASRYIFSPAIFEALDETEPGKGGEIQLTDAIRILLARGAKGVGLKLPEGERRFDIGNYGSYFRAFVDFALADPDYGDALREHLRGQL